MKKISLLALFSLLLLSSCQNNAFYLEKIYTKTDNSYGPTSIIFHKNNLGYTNSDYRYPCYYNLETCRYDFSNRFSWMNIKENSRYIHVYVAGNNSYYDLYGYFYDAHCFVTTDGSIFVNGSSAKYSTL